MLDTTRDPLTALKLRRADLGEQIAGLHEQRTRLRDAETAERDAQAALDVLGRAEVDAIRGWASSGSPGPAPNGDPERRAALTRDLVVAQAAAEAARGAIGDVDQEQADVSREAANLAVQIEMAAVAEMVARFGAELAEVQAGAADLRSAIARVLAISVALFEWADHHEDRGRPEDAQRIRRALQPLLGAVKVDVGPTVAEVHAFKAAHAEHFEGLLR